MNSVGDKSTVSSVFTIPVSHGEKSKNFNGVNVKRWQQKMLFYLKKLNLARFLIKNTPPLDENENDEQVVAVMEVWKYSDFLCINYVLNSLDNTLYNVYCTK